MRAKPSSIAERVRSGYWFIPMLLFAASVALAAFTLAVDRRYPGWSSPVSVLGRGPEAARNLLSTIAGSMITASSVVFSITIVVLALASAQFGPRISDSGDDRAFGHEVARTPPDFDHAVVFASGFEQRRDVDELDVVGSFRVDGRRAVIEPGREHGFGFLRGVRRVVGRGGIDAVDRLVEFVCDRADDVVRLDRARDVVDEVAMTMTRFERGAKRSWLGTQCQ